MDLTTLLGILLAVAGLLGGMYFKHVAFSALANPAAIFMILIGTIGAVLNAFPKSDAKNIGKLFKIIFTDSKDKISDFDAISQITELAQIVRKEGLMALESKLEGITDSFMRRGIELVLLAQPPEVLEEALANDIESMEQRHQSNAQIFTQAGTYAPTLGVLGAVVGLIAALANMEDTEALGHAISAAFIATVYGIFTGYVLWHPFANKLKRKSKLEVKTNNIILAGLMGIARGEHPNIIEESMLSYLSSSSKEKYLLSKS